ncbi:hypothetical protein [Devosia sp. RR2S18]|uniref:hypothetical protein n=1 Tax=Devosia rhizosphaerae TaxID=3049774 RepID=UPI00253FD418|nr:hypothetical protein [Devosia sp. RR2S18]WIJ26303.1 hypothetical protein QOV41_05955 [Devosia sp. RR2S18]
MRTITTTAIAAFLTASIGATAIAPVFAQGSLAPAPAAETTSPAPTQTDAPAPVQFRGPARAGNLLNFGRGAEAVEIALVRLSYRIELRVEQQPLFDAFRAAAVAAAEDASAAQTSLRTAASDSAEQTLIDPAQLLADRIALTRARLAGLEAVQPAATAFFDSLTDDQLAQLAPHRGDGHFHGKPGQREHRGPVNRGFGDDRMAPGQAPRG